MAIATHARATVFMSAPSSPPVSLAVMVLARRQEDADPGEDEGDYNEHEGDCLHGVTLCS